MLNPDKCTDKERKVQKKDLHKRRKCRSQVQKGAAGSEWRPRPLGAPGLEAIALKSGNNVRPAPVGQTGRCGQTWELAKRVLASGQLRRPDRRLPVRHSAYLPPAPTNSKYLHDQLRRIQCGCTVNIIIGAQITGAEV